MFRGCNNKSNKWIKGKFTDIETSPHSQPGACIKILRQDTQGSLPAVFENLILHRHALCDSTCRLRHVEKLINHQPAVTTFCVIDCSVKPAYKPHGGASVSVSVCHDTTVKLHICASVLKLNPFSHYEWCDSCGWHSATVHQHGMM